MDSHGPDRFDAHFGAFPERICVVGEDGVVRWVNSAWSEAAQDIGPGFNYFEATRLEAAAGDVYAKRALDGLMRLCAGGGDAFDMRYPCPAGSATQWFTLRAWAITGDSERQIAVMYTADPSVDPLAESSRESDARFRAILDALPILVIYADEDHRYLTVNAVCEAWYGCPHREIVGKRTSDFLDRQTYERLVAHDAFIAGGEPHVFDERIRYPDGVTRDVEITYVPELNDDGAVSGVFIMARDVTQTFRQRRFLHAIIENIPNMVFVKDARDLRFTLFNKAGEELLGLSREELIGKNDFDFFPDDQAEFFVEKDRAVLRSGDVLDIPEEPIQTKQLGERILHTKKIGVYDTHGRPEYLLGISEDITEKKRTEEKLAESMEAAQAAFVAKKEFLACVSHELRTPLNAVIGFSELVRMGVGAGGDPTNPKKYAGNIGHAGKSLLELINNILDFEKLDAMRLGLDEETFSPSENVRAICSVLNIKARESGVGLSTDLPDGDDTVIGDATRMRQVVTNLVDNAIKFADGGSVSVAVTSAPADDGQVETSVRVADTGIGIAADAVDTIFDPFSQADSSITRRFGGTGLGLSISRDLTRMMGGDIEVESDLGQGSVFTARFVFASRTRGASGD